MRYVKFQLSGKGPAMAWCNPNANSLRNQQQKQRGTAFVIQSNTEAKMNTMYCELVAIKKGLE